ncbi:MAG TPA: hypothetical protein VM123_21420 [archaeon]|nr:hypothetical protein [archaeon]
MSAVRDPRTARLLAERMVNSFFEGLTEAERREIIIGGGECDRFSPLFSMLSHTFDVFLESVSFPEEKGREFFKEAVQKKLKALRDEIS